MNCMTNSECSAKDVERHNGWITFLNRNGPSQCVVRHSLIGNHGLGFRLTRPVPLPTSVGVQGRSSFFLLGSSNAGRQAV